MLVLSIAEGFSRGLVSFYPACCLASREFSLNSIIPTHARPSRKSNYSRTSAITRGRGIYRFLCQTNLPRSFHRNTALSPLSFHTLAHSFVFRSNLSPVSPALSALFPKKQGVPCLVIPIAPERIGRTKLARLGRRPLQRNCSTSHQLALSEAEWSPITSHSSPVAGRWSPATSSPILPTR
jgi:hypothetical protein